ncbi:MAG: AIR synthase related protein [Bryobacteraceae bacterium]
MVGFNKAEGAGVYKLRPECALVQTVDFFTPIVDAPYTLGTVAATTPRSDLDTVGRRPLSAPSIVACPAKSGLEAILRGVTLEIEAPLYDPQTSGGLLVSMPEQDAARFGQDCRGAYLIGRFAARREKPIKLV